MSNDFSKAGPKQQILTVWIIWFVILSGLFVMPFFAPSREPGATSIGSIPEEWSLLSLIAVISVIAGLLCRVLVVPRIKAFEAKFQAMVIGLALCEACGILALFVVDPDLPKERMSLFWASVTAVLVSAPIYMREEKDSSPYRQS